ncbi:MAG TPA: exonuclease domain-containing protein [Tepidisphaeraceae bacterium]|jgi:DNA polymerase-3 subunit epsilon
MAISLIDSLERTPLAFIDTETTGASAQYGDRVIEVGIVRVEGGEVVAEYQQLIDPQQRISPGITALTGIDPSMTAGQPTFAEQLPAMMEFLRGAILVGHNTSFDLSFLRSEFRRCRMTLESELGKTHVLDTLRVARRRFGRGGNGLQALASRLMIEVAGAHRALADAHTTRQLLRILLEPLGGWRCMLCDVLTAQGGAMSLIPPPLELSLPLEIQEAIESKSVVTLEYLDATLQRTRRQIRPLHVKKSGEDLVLVAFCEMRQAQRTFKLDRIVRIEIPV